MKTLFDKLFWLTIFCGCALALASCAGPGEPPKAGDRVWAAIKLATPGIVERLTENPTPTQAVKEGSTLLRDVVLALIGAGTTVAAGGAGVVAVKKSRARNAKKSNATLPPL